VGGALTNALACGRRSRVVLTPRRWRQVCGSLSADDGDNQARSPRRARRKPLKPLRAGMPGVFGVSVVTNARAFYPTRAAAGARAPGIPRALSGERFVHYPGGSRRGNADVWVEFIFSWLFEIWNGWCGAIRRSRMRFCSLPPCGGPRRAKLALEVREGGGHSGGGASEMRSAFRSPIEQLLQHVVHGLTVLRLRLIGLRRGGRRRNGRGRGRGRHRHAAVVAALAQSLLQQVAQGLAELAAE
jgi:hypothetical protein